MCGVAVCRVSSCCDQELNPPVVEDFLYLCDDAYTHSDILEMEQNILSTLDYDINIPVAYRFLRCLARAAEDTHWHATSVRALCRTIPLYMALVWYS